MKKILYSFLALTLALPVMASAATFSFVPSTGSFAPGKTFSVVVYVNPSGGEEITTAKLSSLFSASGLEVISFTQAKDWIPLAVPGSNLIDNVNGKLIKTGGFPARVTASKQFGTLVLKAKSAGVATLSVEGDSMMLDSSNTNKFVSTSGASFTIVTPTLTPTPTNVPKTITSPTVTTEELTVDEEVTASTSQSQTAAAATAGGGASSNLWYYLITALVLLVAGGLYMAQKKKNNS